MSIRILFKSILQIVLSNSYISMLFLFLFYPRKHKDYLEPFFEVLPKSLVYAESEQQV